MSQLLKMTEVAERLAVSRTTLWRLVSTGELPSVLVGQRNRRVPAEALEAYIARQLDEDKDAPEPAA